MRWTVDASFNGRHICVYAPKALADWLNGQRHKLTAAIYKNTRGQQCLRLSTRSGFGGERRSFGTYNGPEFDYSVTWSDWQTLLDGGTPIMFGKMPFDASWHQEHEFLTLEPKGEISTWPKPLKINRGEHRRTSRIPDQGMLELQQTATPHKFTPVQLTLALAYYYSGDPQQNFPKRMWDSPAFSEARAMLRANELITKQGEGTERLTVWVERLCNTQLPVQKVIWE